MAVSIRPFQASDWPALWPVLHGTFSRGDTFAFSPGSTETEIHSAWIQVPKATFVACDEAGGILGSYYLKPNQPGQGDHVCNGGYVVAESARGQGVASLMGGHSLATARRLGFSAMQFNLVVSTNTTAVRLWKRLGFDIVGTLPRAFRHPREGRVDAYVMYQWLAP